MNWTDLIWLGLFVVAGAGAYMVVERLLYFGTHPAADRRMLKLLTDWWQVEGAYEVPDRREFPGLGWVRRLMKASRGDLGMMLDAVDWEEGEVRRFEIALPLLTATAVSGGLLGSVAAMMAWGQSAGADRGVVMGLGMKTTVVGLAISIVLQVAYAITRGPCRRRVEQIEALQEVLEGLESRAAGLETIPAAGSERRAS